MNDQETISDEQTSQTPVDTQNADTTDIEEKNISSDDTITDNSTKPARSKFFKILGCVVCIPIILILALFLRIIIPFHAELCEEYNFTFPNFLISADTSDVNISLIGEYEVNAKILGLFDGKIKIKVSDTKPPEVILRELRIMTGQADVIPEDFVVSASDAQKITYEFISPPDFLTYSGICSFKILAYDESGNSVKLNAYCELDDSISGLTYELGVTANEVESSVAEILGTSKENITLSNAELGEHSIRADDEKYTLLTVNIIDTTAPTAKPNHRDIILGEKLVGEDISSLLTDVFDRSEIFYSYTDGEPDWDTYGKQTVNILLTDACGNTSEVESEIMIHNIPSFITVEAGTKTSELVELLTKDCIDTIPTVDDEYELSDYPLGTHELKFTGLYSNFSVEVTKVDTIPPEIQIKDYTTDRYVLPSPQKFISYCNDATNVTFEYLNTPDVSQMGDVSVDIVAIDEAGNKTIKTATLTVIADTTPPVLYGVKNIYSYEGDSISYRAGVSAVDEVDGKVTVYVDSSAVRTSTAGTYQITYTASDSSGNTAKATAYVIVRQVTQSTLNDCADSILSEIITNNMSEREKAKAIYDWCQDNLKYSTVTSHLMGNYYKAAYSGYKLHYGNCYTYYAVARSLLTRAGITNQMIQRNDPSKPHYWNLVKIDGNWYHFDTCPQPSPNNDGCFLLTDAEVAAYSQKQTGYYDFAKNTYPKTP